MTRLAGKAAFITGGGTGIGRACALLFAQEGAKVAVAGRRREPLDRLVAEVTAAGGEALAVGATLRRRRRSSRPSTRQWRVWGGSTLW